MTPPNNTTLSYSIFSWNIRGMRTARRHYTIYSSLKRHTAHIALLQESHFTAEEALHLQRRWSGQAFSIACSAFARGALIWLRAGIPFQLRDKIIDLGGRYVRLQCRLDGSPLVIGSTYAPNTDLASFLTDLSHCLACWAHLPWILVGDFNCMLNPSLDHSFPPLP